MILLVLDAAVLLLGELLGLRSGSCGGGGAGELGTAAALLALLALAAAVLLLDEPVMRRS